MNAPKLLLALIAALGLALATVLILPASGTSTAGTVTVTEAAAAPGSRATSLQGLAAASAEQGNGAGGRSPRADVAAEADAGRPVRVQVDLPSDAPPDPELRVVAVASELAGDDDAAALLERVRRGDLGSPPPVLAPVDASGLALLSLPEDWSGAHLLLDGQFLYAARAARVQHDDAAANLEALLGASLVVRLPAEHSPTGTLSLTGGNGFGGGSRGFEQRELTQLASTPLAFRALDAGKTWTLMPLFDEHHAYMEMGVELAPGAEVVLDLEVLVGARLRGIVTDAGGTPIAAAEVRTADGSPWLDGADVRSTTTDADGRFELRAVAPGQQELEALCDGWRTARSAALELEDGAELDGIAIVLDRGAALDGLVLWPDGEPASGADVRAEALQRRQGWGGFGGPRVRTVARATTDAAGHFHLSGLDDGAFTVRAEHAPPGATDDTLAPLRAVAEGVSSGSSDLVLTLARPLGFSGRVVDDRGEPVPAFRLEARSAQDGGPTEQQAFEHAQGRFEFLRIGPGSWSLTASAEQHIGSEPLALELPLAAASELELVLPRSASVAGRVLDPAGAPIVGALVRPDGRRGGNPWGGPQGPSAESDNNGDFTLEGLEPGALALVARAEDWADSEPVALELLAGSIREDVHLTVRTGGRIEGGVVTPEGEPVVGRRVTWGENAMGFGSRDETRTDSAGRFAFAHVTPGRWAVSAAPSMAEMGERMRGRERDQSVFAEVMGELVTESVTVADEELVEVWLGGEPRQPVRLFGTVTLGGEALAGAQVFAVSEGSAVFEGMKTAVTASDGGYTLVVDRPGPYALSAQTERLGVEALVDVGRVDEERFDLRIPLGRVQGVVRKPDGAPAAGVQLRIEREDGLGRMRWSGDQASSDEEGAYEFVALEAGRYTVRANVSNWGTQANDAWGKAVVAGVEVAADESTRGIDFDLETAGIVEGLVRGDGGEPTSAATIFLRDSAGRLVTRVSGAQTDAAGRFRLTGLAPGEYTASARGATFAALDDTVLRVASGETTSVELGVEPATALRVRLEDAQGATLRARIEVFDAEGREVGAPLTLEALREAFNQGASSLERRLGPLPSGRYTVRATTADGRVEEKRLRLRGKDGEREVTLRLPAER